MSGGDRGFEVVGRIFAIITGALGILMLVMHFVVNYPLWGLSFPLALWRYFAYMTILSNIGIVLAFFAGGLPNWRLLAVFRLPIVRAALAGYILLVALYYHFFILPGADLSGSRAVPELALHYQMPALYLVWVFLFSGRSDLPFRTAFVLLIPPALYFAFVLFRGALVGHYPYDVIDVTAIGYGGVALNALIFAFIFLVFNALGIALVRVALRRAG